MIVDLVSPWAAAVDGSDPQGACAAFRQRHAPLLEELRRARTPLSDMLRLATDATLLRALARRAADPAMHQQLRAAVAHAADLGADRCRSVILLAGDGAGDPAEPVPWPDGDTALFLECVADDDQLIIALARAVTTLTRRLARDDGPRRDGHESDRLQLARELPLREWIYAEGIGLHLAQALRPGLSVATLIGVSRATFARLRQREKILRAHLADDLDRRGIGLVLRWLTPASPAGPRTVGEIVLPPMAGRYLAWRMLEERVARVGLREAIRLEA